MPLGNGWRSTTWNDASNVTTYPLGNGWYGTQERPAYHGGMQWPSVYPPR